MANADTGNGLACPLLTAGRTSILPPPSNQPRGQRRAWLRTADDRSAGPAGDRGVIMSGVAAASFPAAERRRIQRWVVAVGMLATAEEQRRADVAETNALGHLAAHAACETMLGLIAGNVKPLKPGMEPSFREVLEQAERKADPRLPDNLLDELRIVNRVRDNFVHAGQVVHHLELDRAIECAHDLSERVPMPGNRPLTTVAAVVADMLEVDLIALWLRGASRFTGEGRLRLAADCLAIALGYTLDRAVPRVRREARFPRVSASRAFAMGSDLFEASRNREEAKNREQQQKAIGDLMPWVYATALATPPAVLSGIDDIIGILMGSRVWRPDDAEPAPEQLRYATAQVSRIILRLWLMDSLRSGRYDEQILEKDVELLADPAKLEAKNRSHPPASGGG